MAESQNPMLEEFRNILGPAQFNELIPFYVEEHLAEQSDEYYICDYLNKHFGINCDMSSWKNWLDDFIRSYMYKMHCINLESWSTWCGPRKERPEEL